MSTFLTILRSRWTPAVLVALLALAAVLKLNAWWRAAEEGKRAALALLGEREKAELVAQHFLAQAQERVAELERHRDGLLAVEGDLQSEVERFRRAAGGGQTVAVLDLHSGTVVADGPPGPAGAPSGQGGGAADPGADRGPSPAPTPPTCSVSKGDQLEFDAPGVVERAPYGTDVYLLKLRVRNTSNGWSASGLVSPDLSKIWTTPPPPAPEEARPAGWMVTLLYGRALAAGGASYQGLAHTPPWRVPLLGVPARLAAAGALQPRPDGRGLDVTVSAGLTIELTRWKR